MQKSTKRLFLYSVSCASLSSTDNKYKWNDQILLFCVDENSKTHVVQVQRYNTSILLEPNYEDMQSFKGGNVANLQLPEKSQNSVARVESWNAVKLLGFTNSRPTPVIQIFLKNERQRQWVMKDLKYTNGMQLGTVRITQFLHTRRDAETQFLFDSGLRLNSWFEGCITDDHQAREMFAKGVKVQMANFASLRLTTENLALAPSLRKMYIRVVAHSSTATQTNQFDPSWDIDADEVRCIGYALSNDPDEKSEPQILDISNANNSERDLLIKFGEIIEQSNVHVFVFASDERCCPNSLVYLFRRAKKYGVNMHFSKLPTLNLECEERPCGDDGTYLVFKHPGTERVDICQVLHKAQVNPNLDGFSLLDALRHPTLISDKRLFAKMLHLNYHGLNSFSTQEAIQEDITMQVALLKAIETQSDFTNTQLNISKICDLDLTSVCERGQQARVSNLFGREYHDAGIVINDEQVKENYVVMRKPGSESNYPDPPWLTNPHPSKMRGEKPPSHKICQKLPQHLQHLLEFPHNNVFDIPIEQQNIEKPKIPKDVPMSDFEQDIAAQVQNQKQKHSIETDEKVNKDEDEDDGQEQPPLQSTHGWWSDKKKGDFARKSRKRKTPAEKESRKRFKGGLVLDPEPGFYTEPEEAACTFDFGSLYPSIIEGYVLCYMRVIYDRKWLDDPDLEVEYVPITATECLVLAKSYKGVPVQTITPQIVHGIVQMRKNIRKKQESEEERSFKWNILERAQLAAKVVQNSVYGYIGSDTSGMTCTALAAAVTQIGQWMNRNVRFMILFFGGLVLYGDTDSNMGRMWVASHLKTRDEIFASVYAQAFRIQTFGTKLFNPPNKLEFEAVKIPFLLTNKKKTYAAIQLSSKKEGWKLPPEPKANIKGMALKKRDKCLYAHNIGEALILRLLENNHDPIEAYEAWYTSALDKIPKGIITSIEVLNPFIITCALNSEYKKETGVLAPSLANMIAQETGAKPRPGTRLAYVSAHFKDDRLHADACVIPDIFLRRKDRIDIAYYLEKQIWNCVKQILCLDVHAILRERLDTITKRYINEWKNKRAGRQELTAFFKPVSRTVCSRVT